MVTDNPAWYCARTKPKHEHIAASGLHKNLGLDVFHPQLRLERATRRGVMRIIEPLFPCYVFVRCVLGKNLSAIQHTFGVNGVVRFGNLIPQVSDEILEELQEYFTADAPMSVEEKLSPADEVLIAHGAFAGIRAFVLRVMPARMRVQVLLDILGRPTPVEVDRSAVMRERNSLADLVPVLAAS